MLTTDARAYLEIVKADYEEVAACSRHPVLVELAQALAMRVVDTLKSDGAGQYTLEGVFELLDTFQKRTAELVTELENEILSERNKMWLLSRVREGFDFAYALADEFLDKVNDDVIPGREFVYSSMREQLNNLQVEFLRHMRKPTLYIVPAMVSGRLLSGLNKEVFKTIHEPPEKDPADDIESADDDSESAMHDAFTSEFFEETLKATTQSLGVPDYHPKVTDFYFVIAEGDVPDEGVAHDAYDAAWNSNQEMEYCARVAAFDQATKSVGISSLNAVTAVFAIADSLFKGKKPTNMVLVGDPRDAHIHDGGVCIAGWAYDDTQVMFHDTEFDGESGYDRILPMVMGKIKVA